MTHKHQCVLRSSCNDILLHHVFVWYYKDQYTRYSIWWRINSQKHRCKCKDRQKVSEIAKQSASFTCDWRGTRCTQLPRETPPGATHLALTLAARVKISPHIQYCIKLSHAHYTCDIYTDTARWKAHPIQPARPPCTQRTKKPADSSSPRPETINISNPRPAAEPRICFTPRQTTSYCTWFYDDIITFFKEKEGKRWLASHLTNITVTRILLGETRQI